ncbi:hypothetical protein CABS01_03132 [Colletotrichum abscissum]|uniref:uncharacterized protein n=1 Tax=Colletotrichum abscissum TaxID=1671311 RepID=UPI0027D5A4EE|nr:uncharacterized protein CABS01_03132 [Colletotrichum abscissum]KAK1477830.1 hypothetical protein CABS01_03132 [Colletotrichum abscissum]
MPRLLRLARGARQRGNRLHLRVRPRSTTREDSTVLRRGQNHERVSGSFPKVSNVHPASRSLNQVG